MEMNGKCCAETNGNLSKIPVSGNRPLQRRNRRERIHQPDGFFHGGFAAILAHAATVAVFVAVIGIEKPAAPIGIALDVSKTKWNKYFTN
ncbi:hypothetical protein [Mesorhizobium sp. B2-7-1]|uniref:hypothetical protein n=1 Tax=Mesorhizobium sp. B2-7-1 TaxID=2589909 RepID=UPI00112CAC90|nr:hypothetical protein [Mesorhizobium sp. B2-7-1]TPJ53181.1 hypothetical protein FJ471_27260 [Mesorhizobium sp. B2-7-1]